MMLRKLLLAAVPLMVALLVAGCGGDDGGKSGGDAKGPIRIGLLLDTTGPAAAFGIPERDAIQAAAKQINSNGGVDGRQIELPLYDGKADPTECARGVTQLTRQEKVVAIIGGTTGSCTLAAAPVAARNKVPMLAPNGTIEVTSKENAFHDWVFRSVTSDLINTAVVFDSVVESGAKRVAIFFQEDAYGENTVDYIEKELVGKADGVEIVGKASAPLDATDVTAQATQLRNAEPDAVIMQISSPALGATFVRAAETVGLDADLFGGIGLGQRPFVQAAGKAAEGVNLVVFGNPYEPDPQTEELVNLLPKPQLEGFAELIATNALLAIVEAVKKVEGDATGQALRDALESLCDVKTYSRGELCYSESHDGWERDALTRVKVQGGRFVSVE